jgi:hypothetical protein
MDPEPDPEPEPEPDQAPFFNVFKDARKILFSYTLPAGTLSSIFG